jgi:hypothetical protein
VTGAHVTAPVELGVGVRLLVPGAAVVDVRLLRTKVKPGRRFSVEMDVVVRGVGRAASVVRAGAA